MIIRSCIATLLYSMAWRATPHRIPDAVYHITSRGNGRADIDLDERAEKAFSRYAGTFIGACGGCVMPTA